MKAGKASTVIVAHRNGRTITPVKEVIGGTPETFTYINQAKRASRKLQAQYGHGSVRRS